MKDEYLFFDRRVNCGERSVVDAGNHPTNDGTGSEGGYWVATHL